VTVNSSRSKAPPTAAKKSAAWTFALVGLAALAVSAYYGRQRYLRENPPPLPNVIAPIPEGRVDQVRVGLKLVGATVLKTTPEQQAKIDEIWKNPPRSVEEVIDYQKRTNQVFNAEQRAKFKPMRKRFQNEVIDEMLAPAGKRMPGDDFKKLTDEVKRRVDERIDGPSEP